MELCFFEPFFDCKKGYGVTPTKLLIGQILIVFAVIILSLWFATQWTAHELGYQVRLGPPWFEVSGRSVYKPWRLFQWWYAYEAYAPDVFNRAGIIAGAGGFLGAFTAIAGSIWRARTQKHVTTYGSARWAARQDIERSELLGGDGVFLGTWKDDYLRHNGPEHVMAFAPTRSGTRVETVEAEDWRRRLASFETHCEQACSSSIIACADNTT